MRDAKAVWRVDLVPSATRQDEDRLVRRYIRIDGVALTRGTADMWVYSVPRATSAEIHSIVRALTSNALVASVHRVR